MMYGYQTSSSRPPQSYSTSNNNPAGMQQFSGAVGTVRFPTCHQQNMATNWQQRPGLMQRGIPQPMVQQQGQIPGQHHQGVLLRNALSNTMPSPPPTPPSSSTHNSNNVMFSSHQPCVSTTTYTHHQHMSQQHQQVPQHQQMVYNSHARLQHYRNMQQQSIHMNGGEMPTSTSHGGYAAANHRPSPPPYEMHSKPRLPIPNYMACNNVNNMNSNNNNIITNKPGCENQSINTNHYHHQQQHQVQALAENKAVSTSGGAVSETVMMSPTSLCSTPNDIDERLLDGCDKLVALSHQQTLAGLGVNCAEDEEAILDYYTHLAMELGVHLLKELPELDDVDIMCS